jgi:hypothetical protein
MLVSRLRGASLVRRSKPLRLQLPMDPVERLRRDAEPLVERDRKIARELAPAPEGRAKPSLEGGLKLRPGPQGRKAGDPGREGADE